MFSSQGKWLPTFAMPLTFEYTLKDGTFIICPEMERVSHAGSTGAAMGGGRTLLLDFKNVGTKSGVSPTRCHVLLIHETEVSITESGALVSM